MRYIIAPIVPDAQDREECLSDAALRVWEKFGTYDPARGSWTAWLTALERALTALPQRDRLLFYRKYYYRQSTAQIAAELGTTERAVEGRLYRIKKALRKALGGDDA